MQPEPSIAETTQCLCLAARRASRTITREFDRVLRKHGLRATQFTLLAALHLAGPKSIGELAELLSADRTTLTRNLTVAEQHGWVATRADPGDARSRIAEISTKGTHVLSAALPVWRKTQRALTETIGTEAAASLRRLAGGPCLIDPSAHNPTKETRR